MLAMILKSSGDDAYIAEGSSVMVSHYEHKRNDTQTAFLSHHYPEYIVSFTCSKSLFSQHQEEKKIDDIKLTLKDSQIMVFIPIAIELIEFLQ